MTRWQNWHFSNLIEYGVRSMWPQRFPVSGSRFTTTVGYPNKHACEEACLPPTSSSLWVLHPRQLWETPKGHWGSPARTRSGSVWTLNVLPAPCVAWLVSDSLPLVCARTSFTEVERIVLEFRWVLFWMYIVTWGDAFTVLRFPSRNRPCVCPFTEIAS